LPASPTFQTDAEKCLMSLNKALKLQELFDWPKASFFWVKGLKTGGKSSILRPDIAKI
jgi:hypothetical protein